MWGEPEETKHLYFGSILIYFLRFHHLAFWLLFVEKVTKSHPKTITARFREGALMELSTTVVSASLRCCFRIFRQSDL